MEIHTEINKDDILQTFKPYFEDDSKDFEIFKNLIDNMKNEFIEKLKKKMKAQYKQLHKFIVRHTEEEKFTKDSETKIVKEEKLLDLEKGVIDKITKINTLIERNRESKRNMKEFYSKKTNEFFEKNKYP